MKIVVSACLVGFKCRYDGKSNICKKAIELVKNGEAIPVCPEQLGGLVTPRVPAEIISKKNEKMKVVTKDGKDVTRQFISGAEKALEIARIFDVKEAIFKSNSPSCGCGSIYDGTFSKKIIKGDGITTRLFKKANIKVKTENDI